MLTGEDVESKKHHEINKRSTTTNENKVTKDPWVEKRGRSGFIEDHIIKQVEKVRRWRTLRIIVGTRTSYEVFTNTTGSR